MRSNCDKNHPNNDIHASPELSTIPWNEPDMLCMVYLQWVIFSHYCSEESSAIGFLSFICCYFSFRMYWKWSKNWLSCLPTSPLFLNKGHIPTRQQRGKWLVVCVRLRRNTGSEIMFPHTDVMPQSDAGQTKVFKTRGALSVNPLILFLWLSLTHIHCIMVVIAVYVAYNMEIAGMLN